MWPCDIVRDSHSHSRCSTVSLPLRHLLHKGFISFPILYKWPFRQRCPVSRPITMDSCCLLMFSSLIFWRNILIWCYCFVCRLTVFASELLPLTVCKTDDADELYRELVGSKLMGVPCGGPTRLSHWPGLKAFPEDITLEGIDRNESCGDIVLSSSGINKYYSSDRGLGWKKMKYCSFQPALRPSSAEEFNDVYWQ